MSGEIGVATREVLRTTSLFAGLTDEQLEVVPRVARLRRHQPGDLIVRQGAEDERSLWLVLEGAVEVRVGGAGLRTIGPGNHFGEMALLTGEPRSADVVALTAVTALELSRDQLLELIATDPEVAVAMLAELSRRLRRTTEQLAARTSRSGAPAAAPAGPGPVLGPIEYALAGLDEGDG